MSVLQGRHPENNKRETGRTEDATRSESHVGGGVVLLSKAAGRRMKVRVKEKELQDA